MIKQLRPDPPSEYRRWYNDRLLTLPADRVLDVGKSVYWDYSGIWPHYETMDIDASRHPSILRSITDSGLPSQTYDLILCNGMYEYVVDTARMISEVRRLLRHGGTALFGFVGLSYAHTKAPRFDGDARILRDFDVLEEKHFADEYHFYLCRKP